MKPDHINLVVEDIERSKRFYVQFFGAEEVFRRVISGKWYQTLTGIPGAKADCLILRFADTPFKLELLQFLMPTPLPQDNISHFSTLGYRHLAFSVVDIDVFSAKLSENGIAIFSKPTVNPYGKKMLYFRGPDGELLEACEYPQATPAKNPPSTSNRKEAKLYSDGGSRGNPGPAGAGFVITDGDGKTICNGKKALGTATNNFAEYSALLLGLEAATDLGVTELICLLDSELVVKQLTGEYRVKHPDLLPLFTEVKRRCHQFQKITFQHIPREKNRIADRLANEAMDEAS